METKWRRQMLWGLAGAVGIGVFVVLNGWPLYMLGLGLLDLMLVAVLLLVLKRWRRGRASR